MKKVLNILVLSFIGLLVSSQSWTAGSGVLYSNPVNTRIGVGITAPTELFHINGGALKVGNSTSATDRAINMIRIGDGDYIRIGEWEKDDQLSFKASSYSFTGGYVGIGTNNPLAKLDVNGNIRSNNIHINHVATGDWSYATNIQVNRDLTKALCISKNTGAGEELVFMVLGNSVVNSRKIYAEAFEVRFGCKGDFLA